MLIAGRMRTCCKTDYKFTLIKAFSIKTSHKNFRFTVAAQISSAKSNIIKKKQFFFKILNL